MNKNNHRIEIEATAAILVALIFWSVGPIFIKYLAGYLDSWTQNFLRYCTACLFWLPFLILAFKKKQLDRKVWRVALWPAVVNIVLQSLWAMAFYYINPAFMNLLAKSSIFWIAVFSIFLFAQERPLLKSVVFWSGLGLSIIGVTGVLIFKQDFAAAGTLKGVALALSAAFMWGVYTVLAKIAFKDIDSRWGFSVISIYTVLGLGLLALLFGEVGQCLQMSLCPWMCVVISGILSIAFAHVLYYAAIKRIGATIPTLVLLATPFTVLLISRVVFKESFSGLQWLFGIVLLIGAALAIWAQRDLNPQSNQTPDDY